MLKERHKPVITVFFVFFILIFPRIDASSQGPGTLDPTFGGTGFVTTSSGSVNTMGYGLAVQNDGKIIVAGNSIQNGSASITLARYLTNGSLDNSFGNNGIVVTQTGIASVAYSTAIQNDNKIIAAGGTHVNDSTLRFTAVRYNYDGTTDNTFGNGGVALIDAENSANAYNVAIKSNGKIVISGYSNTNQNTGISLVQLNADGTPDSSFGSGGISINHFSESPDVEAWAMALDANDRIITAGMIYDTGLLRNKIAVVRFNADGSLDSGFGTGGMVKTSTSGNSDEFGNAVTIQQDNKIVIAGSSENSAVIARYATDGTPDPSFGTDGVVVTVFEDNKPTEAYGITVQADGRIIVAGVSGTNAQNGNGNFGLIRFNSDGTSDSSFGVNGKVITDISNGKNDVAFCVKEHSDGKLVVSGISKINNYYEFAVARYLGTSVSVPENSIDKPVEIIPNPASGVFRITGIDKGETEIINMQGQTVYSSKTSHQSTVFHVTGLQAGVYSVKIKTGKRILVKKLVVQ